MSTGYDPEVLAEQLDKFSKILSNMEKENSDLEKHKNQVTAYWTGEDAEAFKGAQGRIKSAIDTFMSEAKKVKKNMEQRKQDYDERVKYRTNTLNG